jgi:hypothetical protein
VEHVPPAIVQTFASFLDFAYLVQRNIQTLNTYAQMDDALERFYHHRQVFQRLNIRPTGFSFPRMHSMKHFKPGLFLFGSGNGICTSITENKHIAAVKEPWRRSSKNKPMLEMLKTISRLNKLSAARAYFGALGMLTGSSLPNAEPAHEGVEECGIAEELDNGLESLDDAQDLIGPRVNAFVTMAARRCTWLLLLQRY